MKKKVVVGMSGRFDSSVACRFNAVKNIFIYPCIFRFKMHFFSDKLVAFRILFIIRKSARQGGFKICAVYDEDSKKHWNEICALADEIRDIRND